MLYVFTQSEIFFSDLPASDGCSCFSSVLYIGLLLVFKTRHSAATRQHSPCLWLVKCCKPCLFHVSMITCKSGKPGSIYWAGNQLHVTVQLDYFVKFSDAEYRLMETAVRWRLCVLTGCGGPLWYAVAARWEELIFAEAAVLVGLEVFICCHALHQPAHGSSGRLQNAHAELWFHCTNYPFRGQNINCLTCISFDSKTPDEAMTVMKWSCCLRLICGSPPNYQADIPQIKFSKWNSNILQHLCCWIHNPLCCSAATKSSAHTL